MSVDGVVEAPSGTEAFERIGWTDGFSRGPDGDQFKLDETMAADAQLLGRITYETFAATLAALRGRVRRLLQRDAEIRRLVDGLGSAVAEHDGALRRRRRGGAQTQGPPRAGHRRPRQRAARADVD